jgi:hypothetical protein
VLDARGGGSGRGNQQLVLTTNLWAGGPNEVSPTADLVERLLVFRSNDQEVFGPILVRRWPRSSCSWQSD